MPTLIFIWVDNAVKGVLGVMIGKREGKLRILQKLTEWTFVVMTLMWGETSGTLNCSSLSFVHVHGNQIPRNCTSLHWSEGVHPLYYLSLMGWITVIMLQADRQYHLTLNLTFAEDSSVAHQEHKSPEMTYLNEPPTPVTDTKVTFHCFLGALLALSGVFSNSALVPTIQHVYYIQPLKALSIQSGPKKSCFYIQVALVLK